MMMLVMMMRMITTMRMMITIMMMSVCVCVGGQVGARLLAPPRVFSRENNKKYKRETGKNAETYEENWKEICKRYQRRSWELYGQRKIK